MQQVKCERCASVQLDVDADAFVHHSSRGFRGSEPLFALGVRGCLWLIESDLRGQVAAR